MEIFKLFGRIMVDSAEAEQSISRTEKKASGAGTSIGNAFKKIGAAIGAAVSVKALSDFKTACVEAAADAQAMESQFSQVFGDLGTKAQESLAKISKDAGALPNRMKSSFTQIAAFAKTTGMDTEDALTLTERAMVAVADSAAFYDRSLEDTTASLQSFLKGNYENDAALGLSCTATTRDAAANALYAKSFDDLSEAQKQLTLLKMVEDANKLSGALGQAARESDTYTNVTGNMKQAVTDFQAEIGKHLLPIVTASINKATDFVVLCTQKVTPAIEKVKAIIQKAGDYLSGKFSPALEKLKKLAGQVKDVIGQVTGTVAGWVGGLLSAETASGWFGSAVDWVVDRVKGFLEICSSAWAALGKYVTPALNTAKQALGALSEKIKPLIDKLKEFNPIGNAFSLVTGGASVKALALKTALKFVMETFAPLISKLADYVKKSGAVEKITETVKKVLDAVGGAFQWVSERVEGLVTGFVGFITSGQAAEDASDWLTGSLSSLRDILSSVYEKIRHFLDKLGEYVASGQASADTTETLRTGWETIKTVFETIRPVFEGVWSALCSIFQGIKDAWGSVSEAVAGLSEDFLSFGGDTKSFFEDVGEIIASVGDTIGDIIATIGEAIAWLLKEADDKTSLIGVAWEALKDAVVTAWELTKTAVQGACDFISGLLDTLAKLLNGDFSGAWTSLKTTVDTVLNDIQTFVDTCISWVVEHLTNMVTTLTNLGGDIMSGLWDGLKSVWDSISTWFNDVVSSITETFTGPVTTLTELGGNIMNGLWDGLKTTWESVSTWFSDIVNSITETFTGPVTTLTELGGNIMSGLWDGLKSVWGSISTWINDVVNSITDWFSGIGAKIASFFGFDGGGDTDGSHASGLASVPYDGYRATLHRGETVLNPNDTAKLVELLQKGGGGGDDRPIHITTQVVLDGRIVGQSVTNYQRRKERTAGA